ncbi:MAG: hypothetical protein AAF620_01040 [Bacteroidota bacterium]
MSQLKDNTPGNRIGKYNIHGQAIEMELSDFNRAFSEDTNHQRLTFGRPGTFKVLYSPSTDHESMCYYPKLKKGEIMETTMIKDLQLIYPGKVTALQKLKFKLKCWFDDNLGWNSF